MPIDYAEKYSQKVDEQFKLASMTATAVNSDYDFVGAQTVKVYSVPTVAMNDYQMSGMSRYGKPENVRTELQELTMTQDRAFTFPIDKRDNMETMGVLKAGEMLGRQISEVIIPEIDIYRLSVIANGAIPANISIDAITKANAYDAFLGASMALTESKAPISGRIAFVSPAFFRAIKLDTSFIHLSDLSQKMLITGQIGEIDGVKIILVPTSYLPANVNFIVTHAVATTAAQKLADYKIHDNPPGLDGWLVEGRVCYDAFVLNNKAPAIYVSKTA